LTIYHQSVFDTWSIDDNSVNSIITSPPYFNLRKYDIPDVIIGGVPNCEHIFGKEIYERKRGNVSGLSAQCGVQKSGVCGVGVNHGSFCIHCQAWKGQYGLESKPFGDEHSYVAHTLLWAKEAWRVMKTIRSISQHEDVG